MIEEKALYIDSIPCLVVVPTEDVRGVVIFYHGWSSCKELQSLRARIMASYGYAVIVPDALNHGQRGLIDYDDKQAYPLFWQAVLQSTQEAGALIAYGEAHWPEQKIFVAGHSMGGITALGVVAAQEKVCGAAALNGSGWWNESDRRFRAAWKIDRTPEWQFLLPHIDEADPYNRVEALSNKSVLLLNGGADDVVDKAAQALYACKLKTAGADVQSVIYDGLGHFVTTNMMGDVVQWLNERIAATGR